MSVMYVYFIYALYKKNKAIEKEINPIIINYLISEVHVYCILGS